MVSSSLLKTILDELHTGGQTQIRLLGSLITVKSCISDSKLWLSTVIYHGENYIPDSVRSCLGAPPPVPHSRIPTFVTINEKKFQLTLNYLGIMPQHNPKELNDVLEQFSWDAEEWRYFLDDLDRRDLIHVPKN